MYSICKTTHPATGVEHSIFCNFFNRAEKCLVVAGANIIRVFRLIPDVDPTKKERFTESRPPKMRLECLAQYTLHGNIMSMQAVQLIGSSRDSLLLSFREAKLSVVEYDPEIHNLRTVSLHYFEEEEIKDGWTNHHHIPIVRVDPEGRCAVMLIYGRKLVVLPFRKDPILDEADFSESNPKSSSKTPILSSYMIVLKTLEEKMDNIIDLQFLHGYYEPTLLILYEPVKTFPGRIAVRQDTCAMVAISLNIQQKVHPIIWSVSNLPFDCCQAVAVKKPLGGTLIMAINSLIYLNQSIPPYGVSLNSLTELCTNFPLKPQDGIKISLESAQVAFISTDRLVISLKTGELYVLSLFADSMRSVRGFHFDKAAASVLTSCVCVCEDNYLFLGSRLGNSLLLRFTENETESINDVSALEMSLNNSSEEPTAKKIRQDFLEDWMASDVCEIKDPEELEVYGNETQTSIQITSYVFEVCDSLLNIGPCGNISMGEPAFVSEEFIQNSDLDVELVTTSGYGKNGALCVLQRSIRPQIVTTFDLPGYENIWTVIHSASTESRGKSETEGTHGFLILTQDDSTMVLQTGNEINEVPDAENGFSTQGTTIFAGNLGSNRYIIQVTQAGVRLLQGLKQVQHMPMDLGCPIIHASCADPYVTLLSEDGQVVLLTLREGRGSARLHAQAVNLLFRPQIEAVCAYRDVSGLFTSILPEDLDEEGFNNDNSDEPQIIENVENEDDLLYGDNSAFQMPAPPPPKISEPLTKKPPWWQQYLQEIKPSYWLFIYRDSGTLEVYSLPDFRLSYLIKNFGFGQSVLHDSMEFTTVQTSSATEPVNRELQVREIAMVALGHHGNRPMLLVRLDSDLHVYQVYRYPKGYLKLRFKKMEHSFTVGFSRVGPKDEDVPRQCEIVRLCMIRYFSNIAGYNGVFICGDYPQWLFLTGRGELRAHPMNVDGPVKSFAPFNNVNCDKGFLYFNRKDELRICVLPTHLSYDAPWPVRKVPLRCTPHFVTYHLESKTYCVVTSTSEPLKSYYKFNGEDKEFTEEERNERFLYPNQEQFSISLFSPISWDTIPNSKIDLDQWEHVTCLKNVSLAYEGTRSGLKGYIVIGTNYNYGEDITSRGRIFIFDIIEVVPEPGQPLTKNRFKQIYAKEQKGPVSAITQVSGFLVSAIGQKIYIWQLKDNDLVGVAFIDTQIYVCQMLSIKSLILVADVFKSVSLLRFQPEYKTLSLVSRDFRTTEIYAIEYLIQNNELGFIVADGESNIAIFSYQPESSQSLGGQKLIRKADIHLGQKINTFFRIKCKNTDSANPSKRFPGSDRRHVTMYATLDGSLGYILPVPEKTYRRLLMLQNLLVSHLYHIAGLNPKAYRTYKSSIRMQGNPARGIIDGDLVAKYFDLSTNEKFEIAKKIGTGPQEIIDDMHEIYKQTSHF